jgi:hypothetical protein
MGKTTTTKYQIRIEVKSGPGHMPMSWNCKRDGRPTEANLRRWVESYEASTRPGGVNAHLGPETITRARILLNDGSGKLVAEYKPEIIGGALFQTVTEYNI